MPTLVELVPYDPKWANDFSTAEGLLRKTLGECVVAVEHIGSTAVPRLAAKPILDVDVIVSGLGDIPDASAALIRAGFEPRGNRYDDDVWAFLLKCPSPQIRVYLCPPTNQTHERRMLFRNYLRQHDDAALAYSTLKRRLAEQFPYDGDRYTLEKSAFISKTVCAAQKDTV
ncbi:GrpB family protein [Ciceribacter selenitireducens]